MRNTLSLTSVLGLALCIPAGWAQQPSTPSPTQPQKRIAVAAGVMAGQRIGGDMPVYPPDAKAAHIEGTVVLQALIAKDGSIQNLRVVSGPPMLQAAAVDAVRTWKYRPYLLNGEPVEVETQINVVFSLAALPPGAQAPVLGGVIGAGAPPSPGAPAHPITAEQVHEMMQLTGAVNISKQMLDGIMPSIRQAMPPYMPPDVLDDFEKTLLGADFEAMIVRTYQAHLSADDGAAILAFYKTPAGQHLLATMPAIAKESQLGGEQLGQQVMMEVLQRHQTEIEAAKEKYEMQHPWTAPKD